MTIAPDRTIPIPEPPPGGFTIADLDEMDDLGHHVELISGGLVVNARPSTWHTTVMLNLWRTVADQAPPEYRVLCEQGVKVDDGTRPEPEVLALRADATDPDASTYTGRDVVLAVEIVSPGSERPGLLQTGGPGYPVVSGRHSGRPVGCRQRDRQVHRLRLSPRGYRCPGRSGAQPARGAARCEDGRLRPRQH